MKKILSLFLICINCCGVHAERTEVYNQHIHTVQVIANNDYMSPAVIRLGENETVEISFDHLTHDYHRFRHDCLPRNERKATWLFLAEMVPPWMITEFFTIANPNPVPPSLRERPLSTR